MMKTSETREHQETMRNERGVALLMTLGILLLLTILALSFSSSQLTENQAATNYYYGAKAEEIARGGLESAIAVLREDARDNPDDPRFSYDHLFERWALYYEKDDGFAGHDSKDADLADYDELEYGVDENADIAGVGSRKDPWKDPEPDSRWIEVRAKDPGTNRERLVGRFAVYVEDETAKVNINIAGNPDPLGKRWTHRRNMGFTTAEIDLGTIFDELGNLFDKVLDNVRAYPYNVSLETALGVVKFRYGYRDGSGDFTLGVPGKEGDDTSTAQLPQLLQQNMNGIDDDGDGLIDEPDEDEDEPGEFAPYDPTRIRAPGALLPDSTTSGGKTGLMGNDLVYLTTPHINLAKDIFGDLAVKVDTTVNPPYPIDRIYRSLLPYITVYSQDLNRFSGGDVGSSSGRGGSEWMIRENIGRWLEKGPSEIEAFLRDSRLGISTSNSDILKQIAVNIYDFIDADWLPTKEGDHIGIEPTLYINEVEPTPLDVPGSAVGVEGWVLDWGEWIELWNPYDIPIDISGYEITTDSSSSNTTPIRSIVGGSTILPPRGFILIGDTRGYVLNTGGIGISGDQMSLPGRPGGCNGYAPLKLDAPLRMILTLRMGRTGTRIVEDRSNIPVGGKDLMSVQKNDPRTEDWRILAATPGTINANLPPADLVLGSFYIPGVRSRSLDALYDPSDPAILQHGGGLSNVGEIGMVHRGEPWTSLNFTGENQYREDAKLLDVLTLPHQYNNDLLETSLDKDLPPAQVIPGRININTAPPEVLLGLNWGRMIDELRLYGLRVSPAFRMAMIQHIIANRPYRNLAHLAETIAKIRLLRDAPESAKEAFMRYNANLITTKSSIFKVTVLAEVVDRRGNLAARRKLEAVVDRGYTPGSSGRSGEKNPSRQDQAKAETARMLFFKWVAEEEQ